MDGFNSFYLKDEAGVNKMSDTNETTSITESLNDISDSVDNAVSGNSQENAQVVQPQGSIKEIAQDAKATLQNPKASKAAKAEAKKTLNKLTLKIDGKEYEEELPFDLPDDPKAIEWMRRELQMGRMGQKRAQEKAALEKDVLQFIEDLKKNPKKALSDPTIGMDLKKFAADIIEEEIENSKKSPEQLKYEEAQRELKELKEQREKEKLTAEEREQERMREHYFQEYETQLMKALETNAIPKSSQAIKKFADYMETAIGANKDVSINDLVPLVQEELRSDLKNHLDALPDDQLEDFIGKDIINRLRKKSVAKVKQTSQNPALKGQVKAPSTGKVDEKVVEPVKKKTLKEMFGV